jgi:transposase
LLSEGIESHVVDAASIATLAPAASAKTDRIDGETLLRALVAHKCGEPRVCSMVRVPTPEDKDRRRIAPILDFATQAIGHGSFSHQL